MKMVWLRGRIEVQRLWLNVNTAACTTVHTRSSWTTTRAQHIAPQARSPGETRNRPTHSRDGRVRRCLDQPTSRDRQCLLRLLTVAVRVLTSFLRVQALSRQASPVKIIQNASSHHCMSAHFCVAHSITPCHFSVGRPKHVRVMAGALEGDVFIGRRAQEFRGLLKIKYPMEHGIVTDWDDMERIWSWIYAEELGTLSEEVRHNPVQLVLRVSDTCLQHPVLLTEAPLNPRSNRDIAAQIFFDTFNVPALFLSVQAVLSL